MKTFQDGAYAMAAPSAAVVAFRILVKKGLLDLAHLARMTLGECALEREVLALFGRQVDMLLVRMASEEPRLVAALAHTLAGSASAIGAWKVAEAATAVERAACEPHGIGLAGLTDHLVGAVAEVHAAIGEIQRAD